MSINLVELKQYPRCFRHFLMDTYEDFIECVNADVDEAIRDIECDRADIHDQSEDALSLQIIRFLRGRGYDASHDTKIGGHTDISVKHSKGFLWVAESKIHTDYNWLEKGFKQLTTRYLAGTQYSRHGGLIIFNKNKNAVQVLQKWKNHLEKQEYKITPCKLDNLFAFNSQSEHSSGVQITVRHKLVNLYFNPEDK